MTKYLKRHFDAVFYNIFTVNLLLFNRDLFFAYLFVTSMSNTSLK